MLVLAVKRRRREETKMAKESQPTNAAGDGAAAFAWSFDGADDQMWLLFFLPSPLGSFYCIVCFLMAYAIHNSCQLSRRVSRLWLIVQHKRISWIL